MLYPDQPIQQIPGQLSWIDPDPTPPEGIPRPSDPAPPIRPDLRIYTTEELVAWGQTQLVETDEDSDLVDQIRNELERRGVRLFGRWSR